MAAATTTTPTSGPVATPIPADHPAAPTPVEAPPGPPPVVEWSFLYEGPIEKFDDRNCIMCNAVAMKACGKADQLHGNADGKAACPSCDAAKLGHCHNHCGLSTALAKHADRHVIDERLMPGFKQASQAVLDALVAQKASYPKATRVYARVVAYGSQDPDNHHTRVTIEVATSP
jgi:hypothetical protein